MPFLATFNNLIITTLFIIFVLIPVFFSLSKFLGFRKLYGDILLYLFEFGRVNIESARPNNNNDNHQDDPSDDEDIPEVCNQSKAHRRQGSDTDVILKSALALRPDKATASKKEKCVLEDCLEYIKSGMEAVIEDDVTSRFEAEELKNWNLLIRTNRGYEFISWKLTVLWFMGFLFRYFILMPLRVVILFTGVCILTLCTALIGWTIPEGELKRILVKATSIFCFEYLSNAISAVFVYHNPENRPVNGICVANHTSPIDVLVLMCDNSYSLIGQRHDGFLGILQNALKRASPHIWFERGEVKDRSAVTTRLRQHIQDPYNPPILIFPEGTCINNTSVMQFKKGSFEVADVIYPVAIKYDARFGDAFWNSSRYSMLYYIFNMMTSWAIVCDVWYLPPMYRESDESAIDYANRVKSVIARQGGLVDLAWDGQLKRMRAKKEWKELQQEKFAESLKEE